MSQTQNQLLDQPDGPETGAGASTSPSTVVSTNTNVELDSTPWITMKSIPGGRFYIQHKPQPDGSNPGPRELTVLRRTAADGTVLWGNETHYEQFMAKGGSAVYEEDLAGIRFDIWAIINPQYWEDLRLGKLPQKRKADEADDTKGGKKSTTRSERLRRIRERARGAYKRDAPETSKAAKSLE
ncbi:hypothetical protein MD484_g7042, partial [Candolleomyces efflorescens]